MTQETIIEATDQSVAEKGQNQSLSLLIVDDDPTYRIFLSKLVEKMNLNDSAAKVQVTASKERMLELLKTDTYDVILLDLYLPDGGGLPMVEEVSKASTKSAVLVITGENDESVGLSAMSCGAQDYLIKGEFNKNDLNKAIHFSLERKRNQMETEEAYSKLTEAHRELQLAQSQMLQNEKLASIGQLAAGVAHEMNTPVGFVASNFETLEKYMAKIISLLQQYDGACDCLQRVEDPEILQKLLDIRNYKIEKKIEFILEDIADLFDESREGFQRVTSIIQNLRDFSRIDQCSDYVEYDLNAGIQSTLVVARNEIKYDAEITTDFGDIPKITGNSGQVNQVFLNILVNGAQAIRSMEPKIEGRIQIRTYRKDAYVVCEITDNGPGMPQDVVSCIFDPFFTTKPTGKGTGLGLSVSYDIIVNKHKGELEVDSQPGQGTTFKIKLPIQLDLKQVEDINKSNVVEMEEF